MPKKLKFKVVHVSGYDDGYGPKELEIHSPVTKGWQSQRFCIYPQEVVLQLNESAHIRKLQILSHQYLIASKIEIFAGLAEDKKAPPLLDCKFKRLGYVSLADNEASNHKTRELKSVNLGIFCHFVKLVVHKNYVNIHNLYNQVNIIAVNLIGDPLNEIYAESNNTAIQTGRGVEDLVEHYLTGRNFAELQKDVLEGNRPDYVSPLDDLAFDIYQDSETARLIRKLDSKKQDAVLEERFDYAKKLKQAIADLQKVGEKLGRFEVEKRRAVEIEDYDLAKAKKLQADEYRLHVYKQLDLQDLLEMKQEEPKKYHQETQQVTNDVKMNRSLPPVQNDSRSPRRNISDSPVLPPITTLAVKTAERASPVYVKTIEQDAQRESPKPQFQEDRPIAALKGNLKFDEQIEKAVQGEKLIGSEGEKPNALSEKDESEASPIIDVYGMYLVQLAYSKIWKHRQEAMESIYSEITLENGKLTVDSDAKSVVRATALLLKKILLDNVFTVFNEAVKVERILLTDYIPRRKLGRSEIGFVIDKTLPALLTKTGDLAVRTKETAFSFVCEIACLKDVKAIGSIPEMLVQPIKSKGQIPWRLFKGRLEVISQLLDPLDIDKQGSFTTDGVMQMVVKALEHNHKEVRESAIDLLFAIYKKIGNAVRTYLPADESSSRKNPLYNRIFDGLDKIDGKPTKAERKMQAKQEKENTDTAKKTEIAALQAQLSALRAVASEFDRGKPETEKDPLVEKDASAQEPDNIEKMCVFCGEQNAKFNSETLDIHYWKSCPMLKRCSHCTQVNEICNLNEHLLTECDKKDDFKKCPRCQEAILKVEFESHLKAKSCPATKGSKSFSRCPLCKEKISIGEEGWKKHLTVDCKANAKRLQQQKQSSKPAEKSAGKKVPTLSSGPAIKRRAPKITDQAGTKS